MAYASLLSLTQLLEQILQSSDESQSALHEEQLHMRSLHGKLGNFLSFLETSSPKNREIISSLEGKIRDATYEAEDLIELYITKQIISQGDMVEENHKEGLLTVLEKLDSILNEVDKMKENNDEGGMQPSKFDDASVQIKDPHIEGLPSILESDSSVEMDGIDEATKVHSGNLLGDSSSESASANQMVGFHDDLLRIKDLLTGSSSRLETISIVGMGGIGKTTLARNIYNASFVERHFDIRAWATVSQEYSEVALLIDLLKSMGNRANVAKLDEIKLKLYQSLKERRYLIVMDDVWDPNILEKFGRIFPDDNNGSRIIMTRRSSQVAYSNDNCSHIQQLSFLSPKQSWNLLCQKAFGKESCSPELEDIGKRIAENCQGLALALVAIGGILHKAEKTRAHWKYIAKNVKSVENGNYNNLLEILSWSYNQLPHHLRACLLYMGVFPEDSVIHVFHLIVLWVANGFIKPVSSKTLEEVAMEYLEDLIDRNLIMVRDRSYNIDGEIRTCVMHDLMREMCIRKAEEENFLVVANNTSMISSETLKSYRHLTINDGVMTSRDWGDMYDSTIRSIRVFKFGDLKDTHFQLLKGFDACHERFVRFPIELVQLVNLRYIALVSEWIHEIPTSISKLCNLQTLLVFKHFYDDGKIVLHPEILKMSQLRHLWVDGGILDPCSGGRNEILQTLSGVRNFILTKKAIGMFPNLKTLGITYDGKSSTAEWGFHCLESLIHLCHLEYLKLRIQTEFLKVPLEVNLEFPVKLRKLSLNGLCLSHTQMSMIGSLPNLEVLKLKCIIFNTEEGWKTNEDEFPKLKFLLVRYPSWLSWDLEGIHFPSLECLTLDDVYHLQHLPNEIGEIPNLRVINLYNCSSSIVASANNIQEDQLEWGNDRIQIHIFSGDVRKGGFRDYMIYSRR